MLGVAKVITLLHAALFAVSGNAHAQAYQTPTIVESSAVQSDGNKDTFIIEQPANSPNPLGNPLNIPNETSKIEQESNNADSLSAPPPKDVPLNSSELGNDFQNTLLEANGMVYDVQAFPKEDIPLIENSANPQTIYSPNVNP
ncbi:MAG: hypothetical protein E7019_01100 [Alphaproteobacteria bacterium]|nr:hypothetical protein [Alphaproteobacteria bacterium]